MEIHIPSITEMIDVASSVTTRLSGAGAVFGFLIWAKKNIPALLDWYLKYRSDRVDVLKKEMEFEKFKKQQEEDDEVDQGSL
jgi:hypothetical protein